jgi:hypothetical protein
VHLSGFFHGNLVVPPAELADCIQRLRLNLKCSIKLIDTLIAVMVGHRSTLALRDESVPIPDQMAGAVPLMLQAAGSSSNTIVRLSDAPGLQTRDCYSIARSVVEIAVNICYIFAKGAPAAELAQRHARQKAYQDLMRESNIGDSHISLECTGRPDASSIEKMEADIAEFTAKGGREKGWVDASIDDRIKTVGNRFGNSVLNRLHFARFMVYRHSSEVLHGTLFSAMHFFGATTPTGEPRTLERATDSIGQQHMMILLATILALLAVVEVFHRAYGFRAAFESAEELLEALRKIPILNPDTMPNPP